MSDKISPIAVIKEAYSVIAASKGLFGLFVLAIIVGTVLQKIVATILPDMVVVASISLTQLLKGAGLSLYLTFGFHCYIAILRECGGRIPQNIMNKWVSLFVRVVALYAAAALVSFVLMLGHPFVKGIMLTVLPLSGIEQTVDGGYYLLATAISWYVCIQWAFWLPSAITGDEIDIVEAAQMVKGHTGSVFLSLLPFMAIMAIGPSAAVLVGAVVGKSALMLGLVVSVILVYAPIAFIMVVFCIWYEELYQRRKMLKEAGDSVETFGSVESTE